MIARLPLELGRETLKSVGAGLVGAAAPGLASLGHADPTAVHAISDVAAVLMPMIFLNAMMSALIPAIVMLWPELRDLRRAEASLVTRVGRAAAMILSLAAGATVAVLVLIHLAATAFSMTGLTAMGILAVRMTQAVLVAAILTPATIFLLSKDQSHG